MASALDAGGKPVGTMSVWAAAKHIGNRCRGENEAFLKCIKDDPSQEKCLHQGRQLTQCAATLLKELHQICNKEPDTNESELEQMKCEETCPF